MKKSQLPQIITLIIILAGVAGYYFVGQEPPINDSNGDLAPASDTIRIAAFNIQVFGRTKREKIEVMDILAETVREFDVVLVQEIRDSSETTAPIFLDHINAIDGPDYAFVRSERLGRSTSKEAYAYFYNTQTVSYLEGTAYVWDDTGDVFEREPYIASFTSGYFDFTLVGIHTKPDDAEHEIGNLTIVFETLMDHDEQDIIALGDFNADGSYYDEDDYGMPLRVPGYFWVVSNEFDTMTKTDWTYDRIVMLDSTYSGEYIQDSTQVYDFQSIHELSQDFTEEVSDHFPVYAEFRVDQPDDD
jgi:endonuclease/exonuclease/phosphatase family metal-dependent hydrolase